MLFSSKALIPICILRASRCINAWTCWVPGWVYEWVRYQVSLCTGKTQQAQVRVPKWFSPLVVVILCHRQQFSSVWLESYVLGLRVHYFGRYAECGFKEPPVGYIGMPPLMPRLQTILWRFELRAGNESCSLQIGFPALPRVNFYFQTVQKITNIITFLVIKCLSDTRISGCVLLRFVI